MTNDLYFLPIIADALRETETETALKAAFEKIETMGRQPHYERGFIQFRRFMTEVKRNLENPSSKTEDYASEIVKWLVLQVAGGLLEEDEAIAVLDLIGLGLNWRAELERLFTETSESDMGRTPEIIIERNGEPFASISCEQLPVTSEIENVTHGFYSVKFDTGRIIWEEKLTEQELIWIYAFPEQALDLAADTEVAIERTTREITLLNGSLIIRVFPGAESGLLELNIGGATRFV